MDEGAEPMDVRLHSLLHHPPTAWVKFELDFSYQIVYVTKLV